MEMHAADRVEKLEQEVLRPLTGTSRAWYAWVGFLLVLIGFGFYAYLTQLRNGLQETGMGNTVVWGFYITNFVFFIGISHAGTLISAILRVTGAEWRRPITRMAELITVVALMVGGLMPVIDLGRPDRVLNLILHGRLESPIMWDFLAVSTYLTGSLIYLYLPLIPDLALIRDRLTSSSSTLRRRAYTALALGWTGSVQQRKRLNKAMGVMMILIIPIAVSVHTVVSWLFAMTLRPGWDSTIFGPYFVVGAIFSGVAGIITVMFIFRKVYHLQEYITDKHFKLLGMLLLAMAVIYMYFTLAEYLTIAYKLEEGEKQLLEELFVGQYAWAFWTFGLGGTLLPAVLIALPWTNNIPGIVIASVLVNIGMWLKRFIIVVPSLSVPLMPYEWGRYSPSWVEIAITVASFAGFALIFTLAAKLFPLVSAWEVKEGWEKEEEAVAAIRAAAFPQEGTRVPEAASGGGS
jgi:Ni/Fe-hydrogenase subunit HybB-like protein